MANRKGRKIKNPILILLLAIVKYLTAFGVGQLAAVLPPAAKASLTHWVAPIGLSYVALQMIGYLLDVARGAVERLNAVDNSVQACGPATAVAGG